MIRPNSAPLDTFGHDMHRLLDCVARVNQEIEAIRRERDDATTRAALSRIARAHARKRLRRLQPAMVGGR